MKSKIGIIVLAAGSSSRLGESKQLLAYKGKSLLKHAVQQAVASKCVPTLVVLGARFESHMMEIENEPAHIEVNSEWERGIGTSIACGVRTLVAQQNTLEAVVIMLCDQPFIDSDLINQLIAESDKSEKGIVACRYGNTIGTPALFNRKYFGDLQELKENAGAKALFGRYSGDLQTIDFPLGETDIDTQLDYKKLLSSKKTIEN